jgi:hypothetical protein
MSIATKVIYDQKENTISLEKHQTSPVQLTNIKRERVANQSQAKARRSSASTERLLFNIRLAAPHRYLSCVVSCSD